MKNYGTTHQYACFACRKCFKQKQPSPAYNRFMTSEQIQGQASETKDLYNDREYICPDCGGSMYFMGTDFKAPKRTNMKAWDEAERFIRSGNIYYRGSQDKK